MKQDLLDKVFAFIKLLRLLNLLMIVAIFWLVQYVVFEPIFALYGFALQLKNSYFDAFTLAALLVTVGGYLINDWFDKKIDSINKPKRFLVSRGSKNQVFVLYGLLNFIAIGLSVYLSVVCANPAIVLILLIYALCFFWYAIALKRKGLLGNLLVSLLIGAVPWLVCLLNFSVFLQINKLFPEITLNLIGHLSAFSMLMFLSNLGRELAKDAEDARGDALHNVDSVFLKHGASKTRKLIFASVLIVVVIEVLLLVNSKWVTISFFYTTFLTVLVQLVMLKYLLKTSNPSGFRKISLWLKVVMLFGLAQLAMLSPI